MNARLIALAGPSRGKSFDLTEDDFSIGVRTVDVLNPAYSDSIINAILSPGCTSWVAMEPHCRNHHSGKDGRFYLTGNDGVWDC